MLDDVTYFGLREFEETKAALEAADPKSRACHIELARRYREWADAIAVHEDRTELSP